MSYLIILLLSVIALSAETFEEYQRKQAAEYRVYRKHQKRELKAAMLLNEKEFKKWQEENRREFALFQKEIKKAWGVFRKPTQKVWVEYGRDKQSLSRVDFEKGVFTVQVLVDSRESPQIVEAKLMSAVERAVQSKGSGRAAPVEDKRATVTKRPILEGQIKGLSNSSPATVKKVAREIVKKGGSKKKVANQKEIVTISVELVPNHLQKRMKPYLSDIRKYSTHFDVSTAQVIATMHTESYFNPMARSPVGAIGLMQLMPGSGGYDAYQYVYNKNQRPTATYLYNAQNNIELGCAYIAILEGRYFKNVTNSKSRTYCAIAAYNTGAGNVAKAFTGKGRLSPAITIINEHDPLWVYNKMLQDLPYNETKGYLKKVTKRRDKYKKAGL